MRVGGLSGFQVQVEQTDLFIRAQRDLSTEALDLVIKGRTVILDWAKDHAGFLTSLEPLDQDPLAPPPVREMLAAGCLAQVGPMAAVAGSLAEYVGRGLLPHSPSGMVVENGGDIFIATDRERNIGIYAGDSVLSGKVAIRIKPEATPAGISTSSATGGHSLSFGKADAVTIVSSDACLADASATAVCNRVKDASCIKEALHFAKSIEGVKGCVVIYKDKIGSIGDIELIQGGAP